ncbi:MAG: hypothetical protein QM664_08050 [Flavihumibacter sp.]
MKKFLSISFALVYLLVSAGLLVEVHHCMGRVANADIQFFAGAASATCCKCGMEKNLEGKHCCKDEVKQVKISDDQQLSFWQYAPSATHWIALPQPFFAWQAASLPVAFRQVAWLAKPPPGIPRHETFYLNVFRI